MARAEQNRYKTGMQRSKHLPQTGSSTNAHTAVTPFALDKMLNIMMTSYITFYVH
jgi:hypothetical protein